MPILTNYSPNHSKNVRRKREIKFVILHYTGMQSEIESIKKLKNPKFKVSCHYLINRRGKIIQMVEDKYVAWHAGKSKWKSFSNMNKNSIGIELVNKGHEFGYQYFSKPQIRSLIWLCKKLKKKYSIKTENFLGHSDIAPLRKIDPGEKFPWKVLNNNKLGKWYRLKRIKNNIDLKNKKKTFFKNLQKIGYRYFSIKKRSIHDKRVVYCFQQHYLPNNLSGKIDKKTLKISVFLTS